MHVLATAGHVDHGKSALVRALTGIEPDRWAEEHRRGLTIDLGYAWTTLDSGAEVAFVDVPGHQRFIGNMLAGLGPAPAVVFVVAADEGWRQQSQEHLAAVDALGIRHGLLVVTRSDLADPAPTLADAAVRLRATSLGEVAGVAVSALTGDGLPDLRAALDGLVAGLPRPRSDGRVRLWVDRSFTIRGSGTVVTGTLGEGSIAVGDELEVADTVVGVRSLQSMEASRERVSPVCRVAANLRGMRQGGVTRGDVLLTPGAWRFATVLDVRLGVTPPHELAQHLTLHVGTAAVPVHVRPLGGDAVRLTLSRALPLVAGDRLILRDPGAQQVVAGAVVVDADPPELRRRGAAARRATALATATGAPDVAVEVERRGALRVDHALALGIAVPEHATGLPGSVLRHGDWLVSRAAADRWAETVVDAVRRKAATDPLEPSLTAEAARLVAGVPDSSLLPVVVDRGGLELERGRVWLPGVRAELGPAGRGLRDLEERLSQTPFAAPEQRDLEAAGLGPREVAAAVKAGRLLRLPDGVLLLPDAPARAMRVLAALPQPFTLSQARQALQTTRRVAVPLLEHLDSRGWTRRVDTVHRRVVPSGTTLDRPGGTVSTG
ncbi:selenocysteine-specific translation elongation factor [Pedococcus bigeumensis]|uniref:Selenocysteine-specific translation elongation factor n=1 Tax=Pedococcus bigeumensis TaxID=433644 RepID=A0A502CK11_9MICO|nr:selenocysteine-specific translation elongation factor [Pedococcus bigeumensis]TPG12920.1 selenocysteine-specific translation elongation factor [Pedococcus bigeumensis]